MAEKKRHPVRNTATGVGIVALLALLLGGRLGFGGGGSGGEGLLPAESDMTETAVEATAEPVQKPDDGVLSITVREDGVLYEGESVTLAELEAALLGDYKEGVTVELTDDHALKANFDEVTALLEKLSIDYTEK